MIQNTNTNRPRGRPRKDPAEMLAIRENLIRAGVEALTIKGFASSGLDEILNKVGVPKGSFYHYFDSKEAFGIELIKRYAAYFARRLDSSYKNEDLTPLERIHDFVSLARANLARYDFQRGCLVGNLGQELAVLPESYCQLLIDVLHDWQARTAACLRLAQAANEISSELDCDAVAAAFWIGWEGAILRAKLERNAAPIDLFASHFLGSLRV